MYKIGVAGASGSGKSTFVDFLAIELPNSEIVDGDRYMKQAFELYSDLFAELFGPLERKPDGRVKLKNFGLDAERFSKTLEIIAPFVNDRIVWHIENLSDATKFVLVDWANLPILDVWGDMRKRFVISTNSDVMLERLIIRDAPNDTAEEEWIKSRIKYTWLSYAGFDGVVISNNDNKKGLLEKAIGVKQMIMRELECE